MSKMEFSYSQTDLYGKVEKTYNVSTNNLVLTEILEDFEMFLKGCGFVLPENYCLDVVPSEFSDDFYDKLPPDDIGHSEHFFDTERNK
jgi:hypothetical protein